jgi:hypothetical protein
VAWARKYSVKIESTLKIVVSKTMSLLKHHAFAELTEIAGELPLIFNATTAKTALRFDFRRNKLPHCMQCHLPNWAIPTLW